MISWQLARKKILALATTTQRLLDYTGNRDRNRDTVCLTVDDAVAGLLDDGWSEIHLVGYSFGSLILFDSVLPKLTSWKASEPIRSVKSLTTIGCPLDMVRLFHPSYTTKRQDRRQLDLKWINIFNAADVFGSNFVTRDDAVDGAVAVNELVEQARAREGEVAGDAMIHYTANSYRYLDERLTLWQVLVKAKGLRVHGGYWGSDDEAHCFEPLVSYLLSVEPTQGAASAQSLATSPVSAGRKLSSNGTLPTETLLGGLGTVPPQT